MWLLTCVARYRRRISYDHEDFLGNSIKKITSEKLGIIKKNNYVIIGKQKSEIETFIRKKIINILLSSV